MYKYWSSVDFDILSWFLELTSGRISGTPSRGYPGDTPGSSGFIIVTYVGSSNAMQWLNDDSLA